VLRAQFLNQSVVVAIVVYSSVIVSRRQQQAANRVSVRMPSSTVVEAARVNLNVYSTGVLVPGEMNTSFQQILRCIVNFSVLHESNKSYCGIRDLPANNVGTIPGIYTCPANTLIFFMMPAIISTCPYKVLYLGDFRISFSYKTLTSTCTFAMME
jgi:hypothetical protein